MDNWATAGEEHGYFYVCDLSRDDIEYLGFDPTGLDTMAMRKIADRLSEPLIAEKWGALPIILEAMGIPKLADEDEVRLANEWYAQTPFDIMEEISGIYRCQFDGGEEGDEDFIEAVDKWWQNLPGVEKVDWYNEYIK